MELEEKKVYKNKKISTLYMSIWFLIFSIILTGGLYAYNITLANQNTELNNEIKTKNNSISELEKDQNIIISSLYNSNKSSIKKLEDYSKITLYINHLLKLSRIYNIDFKWFRYSAWKLSTTAISSSEWVESLNYEKTANFIKKYRENKNKDALFDLELIKNISTKNEWVDNEFNITLNLKNNISKILEQAEITKKENLKKKEEEDRIKTEQFKARKKALLKKKQEKEKLQNSSGSVSE